MIGGQPEEAPHNWNLSMSSRKSPESWFRPAEKKRGAGTSSNASDVVPQQVSTGMEENRLIPEQNGSGNEKQADGRASEGRSRRILE
eukprot:1989002-Pleurochrysis_carterae.AAC.1